MDQGLINVIINAIINVPRFFFTCPTVVCILAPQRAPGVDTSLSSFMVWCLVCVVHDLITLYIELKYKF